MRLKIFIVICMFWFSYFAPTIANALTPQILASETGNVETKKMNIIENLSYRLFEKDTRDAWDYLLLAILVVGLLIVMVFQNTRYYIVTKKEEPISDLLLEENNLTLVEQITPVEKVISENRESVKHKPRRPKRRPIKKDV